MTSLEAARLVAELVGIVVFTGGGLSYLVRQTWRILDGLEATTAQLKILNGTVAEHSQHFVALDQHIALQNIEVARLVGYVQGRKDAEESNEPA